MELERRYTTEEVAERLRCKPQTVTRCRILFIITVVFPEPGPARTCIGPDRWATALC